MYLPCWLFALRFICGHCMMYATERLLKTIYSVQVVYRNVKVNHTSSSALGIAWSSWTNKMIQFISTVTAFLFTSFCLVIRNPCDFEILDGLVLKVTWNSSWWWGLGCELGDEEILILFLAGEYISLFSKESNSCTPLSLLFSGNWGLPGCEAGHSRASGAKVQNEWS